MRLLCVYITSMRQTKELVTGCRRIYILEGRLSDRDFNHCYPTRSDHGFNNTNRLSSSLILERQSQKERKKIHSGIKRWSYAYAIDRRTLLPDCFGCPTLHWRISFDAFNSDEPKLLRRLRVRHLSPCTAFWVAMTNVKKTHLARALCMAFLDM